MRTGLLGRFWASLGMALGVALLIGLVIFTLVWFLYFALLLLGLVPGGKPPAWAAGESIPWPTPGEKAADELSPDEGDDPVLPAADEESSADPSVDEESSADRALGDPPRKRKQRD